MSEFNSSDREVIRLLFSSQDWVDLYSLHEGLGLSPAQIVDILERLKAVDLAESHDALARLTKAGRDWVLAARGAIFCDINKDSWRPSRAQLFSDATSPSTPYLPDLQLVDRDFFIEFAFENKADDDKE